MRRDRTVIGVVILTVLTLWYLCWQIGRWATPKPHRSTPPSTLSLSVIPVTAPETTTTAAPTTTTTAAPPTTTTTQQRASRGTPRSEHGDAFWLALGQCESELGRTSRNIFQFSGDTAAKVGIDGSESYEVQRAAAITWAARIHPNEGTKSGWPHCWWVALAGEMSA